MNNIVLYVSTPEGCRQLPAKGHLLQISDWLWESGQLVIHMLLPRKN